MTSPFGGRNGSDGPFRSKGSPPTVILKSDNRKERQNMADQTPQADALLTPAEVAALFRVNPKTVTRWARAGKITAIRTLGGHRRFRASEIRRCLEQMETEHQA
jgi:excisionase family DNA binding protein